MKGVRAPSGRYALRARWALVAAAALAATALGATAAAAPGGGGIAVRPLFAGQTSLPAGHFTYALPAGARVSDGLVVGSTEPSPVRVAVYGADVLPAEGGGLGPAPLGQAMRGVGAWLSVVALPAPLHAGADADAAFTLTVPPGTAPGTYEGAVVAQAAAGSTCAGVAVGLRVALLVHVTVVAVALPALTVGPVDGSGSGPGAEALSVTVRNGGNVNLGVAGTVVVRGPAGAPAARVVLGPKGLYAVPGGSAVLRGRFSWRPGLRRATAAAVIDATVGEAAGPTYAGPATKLTRPGASPWAEAVAALLAAAGARLAVGGRRSRRAPARPAPP